MHAEELQRRLDLLADEELSPAEERELLAQLEQVPGGWRRCALALLEARSWQRALHDWPAGAPSEPASPSSSLPAPAQAECPRRSPWHLRESVAWAVVAVSLLVAGFALGRQFALPGGDAAPGSAPLVASPGKTPPVPAGGTPRDFPSRVPGPLRFHVGSGAGRTLLPRGAWSAAWWRRRLPRAWTARRCGPRTCSLPSGFAPCRCWDTASRSASTGTRFRRPMEPRCCCPSTKSTSCRPIAPESSKGARGRGNGHPGRMFRSID